MTALTGAEWLKLLLSLSLSGGKEVVPVRPLHKTRKVEDGAWNPLFGFSVSWREGGSV